MRRDFRLQSCACRGKWKEAQTLNPAVRAVDCPDDGCPSFRCDMPAVMGEVRFADSVNDVTKTECGPAQSVFHVQNHFVRICLSAGSLRTAGEDGDHGFVCDTVWMGNNHHRMWSVKARRRVAVNVPGLHSSSSGVEKDALLMAAAIRSFSASPASGPQHCAHSSFVRGFNPSKIPAFRLTALTGDNVMVPSGFGVKAKICPGLMSGSTTRRLSSALTVIILGLSH